MLSEVVHGLAVVNALACHTPKVESLGCSLGDVWLSLVDFLQVISGIIFFNGLFCRLLQGLGVRLYVSVSNTCIIMYQRPLCLYISL